MKTKTGMLTWFTVRFSHNKVPSSMTVLSTFQNTLSNPLQRTFTLMQYRNLDTAEDKQMYIKT